MVSFGHLHLMTAMEARLLCKSSYPRGGLTFEVKYLSLGRYRVEALERRVAMRVKWNDILYRFWDSVPQ
jgi:hypothetical protein